MLFYSNIHKYIHNFLLLVYHHVFHIRKLIYHYKLDLFKLKVMSLHYYMHYCYIAKMMAEYKKNSSSPYFLVINSLQLSKKYEDATWRRRVHLMMIMMMIIIAALLLFIMAIDWFYKKISKEDFSSSYCYIKWWNLYELWKVFSQFVICNFWVHTKHIFHLPCRECLLTCRRRQKSQLTITAHIGTQFTTTANYLYQWVNE